MNREVRCQCLNWQVEKMTKKKAQSKQPDTKEARDVIAEIEKMRGNRLVVYVSRGSIGPWDILPLHELLSKMGHQEHLDFLIQSGGGYVDDAYHMADVLHEFCNRLSVIVPTRAKSAATIVCLSGSVIFMGPTSELGPTDPMIEVDQDLVTPSASPFERRQKGDEPKDTTQINAHALRDFLEAVGVINGDGKYDLDKLCIFMEKGILNPWLIGDFERSTRQSKQFAENLLSRYMFRNKTKKKELIPQIVNKLCEGYYHHSYPIGRKEARELGLEIEDMTQELCDITSDLMLAYGRMMREQKIRTLIETSDNFFVKYYPK